VDKRTETTHEDTFHENLKEETLFHRLSIVFHFKCSACGGAKRGIFYEKFRGVMGDGGRHGFSPICSR
jgi:hypothetical protein